MSQLRARVPIGKPIFNILEHSVTVILANPQDVKSPQGVQDRSERQLVVSSSVAARDDPSEFYPSAGHSRVARSDTSAQTTSSPWD